MSNDKKKNVKKDVELLMSASKQNPDDSDSGIHDSIYEVRATTCVLLMHLSDVISHLLESIPFDLKRIKEMDLIRTELEEIREHHFGDIEFEDKED